MRLVQLEGVQVDLCPNCMGMWFDTGELSRATGLKFRDTARGAAIVHAKRTVHRCPSCAIPLREREIDRGCGIFIDQCPQCSGLFLDRDEFSRAKDYFRHRAVAVRPRPAAEPSGPREQPVEIDPDSFGAKLFQYVSGLPLELGVRQTLVPPVVTTLIVINLAVLIIALATQYRSWIEFLGLVPADVTSGRRLYTFLTSMFMHAGAFHLLGNMYFLYISGDNVEERFGWWKFLAFYLLCGVVADLSHVAGNPASRMPSVGASGAISGVMGAYVILFPYVRFRVRWFYFLWCHFTVDFPCYLYMGLWLAMQLIFAALQVPCVAWWAHIGGFACGAAIAGYVRLRERVPDTTTTRRAQR